MKGPGSITSKETRPPATNAILEADHGAMLDPILKKTWQKIDCRLIPMMTILSILSSIDQASIGNARIANLQRDLKMTNHQFSMVLTLPTIFSILVSFPANLALKSVGPNIMLPTSLTLWAIATVLQGVTKNYWELLVCRFLLGLFAGSAFTNILLYLAFWYPRQHLQKRISAILAISSTASAFSGIFAYGVIRMDGVGHLPGWSWIFILEGLFSFLYGLLLFFILPHSPRHARFLQENEKEYVISQLQNSGAIDRDEQMDLFRWREIGQAFTLPHVWMLCVMGFFTGVVLVSIVFFMPSIVAELGYTNIQAQIYSVPPVVVASVSAVFSSYLSDRFTMRGLIIITSYGLTAIGLTIFLTAGSLHVKYGSLFLTISGAYSASIAQVTWVVNNIAPYTRRATAFASASIMVDLGGIVAVWLLGTLSPPPLYKAATITLLILSVLMMLLAAMKIAYLSSQNRKKAKVRETSSRESEEPGLGDRSAWFIYSL